MAGLDGKYNFKLSEEKWNKYWQDNKIFAFDWQERNKNNTFSIDTPPPGISGHLHMGHIFGFTQMDSVARFNRMLGKNVFFPIGYDDNGLPSERYVEKKINKKSQSMPRQEFIDICNKEILVAEDEMRKLFISIAFSFDFSLEYRTISKTSQKVSQMSFLDLYKKGHMYRRQEPVIWDVFAQTALAQSELDDVELKSQMNYLKFTTIDNSGKEEPLEIMTTRPELLPACVAVFCHPDDFYKYKGKKARTPLGVEVPIIADETVDREKGTAVMMCCTFGDQADVEKWKKHNLDLKIILDEKGCLKLDNIELKQEYKEQLEGLFVEKARAKILEILEKENKIMRPAVAVNHIVKVGDRTKYPVEILIKEQWLIDVLSIKDILHQQADKINWKPDYMKIRIHNWIDGLSWDWCVSRQRFFGVPVPVWYSKRKGEEGKILLPTVEQLPVDPTVDLPVGYTRDEVMGEADVFDTWATSAVSPQLSTHHINEQFNFDNRITKSVELPFNLRLQGHDIIRTWAFDTIVKAYYHENKIPWENLLINGFCLAEDGSKMSKSVGNIIDPVKILKDYGSDAVRYWCLNSTLGIDTSFSHDVVKLGQKLITKLFNASKFAEMQFENLKNFDFDIKKDIQQKNIFETMDIWAISKLKKLIDDYMNNFKNFNFSRCLNITEEFFWNVFCDNYLEIVKVRCYGADGFKYKDLQLTEQQKIHIDRQQQSALKTIYYILNVILKLFAPFMPTITEEIFSCVYETEFKTIKSIHSRNSFSNIFDFVKNQELEQLGDEALNIIMDIRKYKSEHNMSMKDIIKTVNVNTKYDLTSCIEDLKNVCNVENSDINKTEQYNLTIGD